MANELIAPYLNEINTHRKNIRQALIDKGVDMTGVAFSGYASKIAEITGESIETDVNLPTTNSEEVEIGKLNGTKVYCKFASGSLAKDNDLAIATGTLIACGGKYTRASLNDTFHIGFINGDESNFSQMVYVDGTNSSIKLRNKGTTSYFNPISFELYVIYSK